MLVCVHVCLAQIVGQFVARGNCPQLLMSEVREFVLRGLF